MNAKTTTTVTLSPCPFHDASDDAPVLSALISSTGGGAAVTSSNAHVTCPVCGVFMSGGTIEQAASKWNGRAEGGTDPVPPDPPDPSPSQVRFYPSHCMTVDTGSGGGGIDGWEDQIASIAQYKHWKMAGVLMNWVDLEPSTRGVYDFTKFDRLVTACKNSRDADGVAKKLKIGIKFQWFSSSPTSTSGKIPKYLDTIKDGQPGYSLRPEGETWNGNLSLYVHLHDERVMTPYIQMMQALARHIGNDQTLQILGFGETAVDAPSSSGFTTEKWFNQIVRYAHEMRIAFPYIEIRIGTNYLGDKQVMCELLDELDKYDSMPGGPDNYSRSYDSNLAMSGQVDGVDRRGRMAWCSENQRPASSSGGNVLTPPIYQHNTTGDVTKGGSMKPHYWQWSKTSNWAEVRNYIESIQGATNTVNPHVGKTVTRAAPRFIRVKNPMTAVVIPDDTWEDSTPPSDYEGAGGERGEGGIRAPGRN